MKYYNQYKIIAFESMDFQVQNRNIEPGQSYVPLLSVFGQFDHDGTQIANYLLELLSRKEGGVFKRKKIIRQWVKRA